MSFLNGLGFLPPRDLGAGLRDRIETLSREMSEGRKADVGTALRSDFSRVSQVARDLRMHDASSAALKSGASWGRALQSALGSMSDGLAVLGETRVTAMPDDGAMNLPLLAVSGEGALRDMVARLNGDQGGRALFANGDPSRASGIDADAILSDLRSIAAASTDSQHLIAAIDGYFAPGGLYETTIVGPLPSVPASHPVPGSSAAAWEVDAVSPEIRSALSTMGLTAVMPDAGFAIAGSDRSVLAAAITEGVVKGTDAMARLQGRLGVVEARIERHSASLDEARNSAESDLAAAVSADPYETATRLQDEMSRLETTYAITARRATLRLTDWLR